MFRTIPFFQVYPSSPRDRTTGESCHNWMLDHYPDSVGRIADMDMTTCRSDHHLHLYYRLAIQTEPEPELSTSVFRSTSNADPKKARKRANIKQQRAANPRETLDTCSFVARWYGVEHASFFSNHRAQRTATRRFHLATRHTRTYSRVVIPTSRCYWKRTGWSGGHTRDRGACEVRISCAIAFFGLCI